MSDTPKSFRELAREWMEEFHRISSQHFGDVRAEDIANNYRVLAQELNALANEWERYSQNEYCPASIATQMLGEERR